MQQLATPLQYHGLLGGVLRRFEGTVLGGHFGSVNGPLRHDPADLSIWLLCAGNGPNYSRISPRAPLLPKYTLLPTVHHNDNPHDDYTAAIPAFY